ncbi:hypothetical protein MKK75_03685 [Methylobacterium sp. J-030]|uniref:hypothetical protein n=1 Tax=Methylobacterium sp. J-030 TaxID=2836627 RepID=UPI001FB86AEF|nr:hypothetical protein [Methylobacterium sp. J-030]MCJ2067919.1 hypothetical protein [Methylobacterium sp. J-030]
MTVSNLEIRLRRIEVRRIFRGEIASASDRQLMAFIRSGYADLRAEHGSLAEAVWHLRETGDAGDAALATLIEEDIGGRDARFH